MTSIASTIGTNSPVFPTDKYCSSSVTGIKSGIKEGGSPQKGDSLDNLTTEKIVIPSREEEKRINTPFDLTRGELRSIGINSNVAKLQSGVVRLRVEVNGKSLGCGSGIVISADGLILSVNHVPALGQQASEKPFDLLTGTSVLKNLKAWSEFTSGKGDVRLFADFVQLPKEPLPETIFTPSSGHSPKDIYEHAKATLSGRNDSATRYSREEDTIDIKSYPVRILAESPSQDLMLCKVDIPETQDPFPFVKITDSLLTPGDLVYSIGHPGGIKHNALALGEVLDPNFDVNKLKEAASAHALILGGIANVIGGKGINAKMPAEILKGLSVAFAGVDVESLINFMNGAVVSTNNIAPGSSGGLLTNRDGEGVGVTYLGALMPFNDTALIRYAAGVLGFNTRNLPLTHITGSVGMNTKAIPFLRDYGVDIQRIRDGEPSGVADIEKRVAKGKAREAMAAHFRTSGVSETEIPGKLSELGLGEDVQAPSPIQTSATDTSSKYFIGIGDDKISFPSKPVQINDLTVDKEDSNLQITLKVKCEGGEEIDAKVKIDPSNFDLNTFSDTETRNLVTTYLISNPDKLTDLERLQREITGTSGAA